MLQLVAIKIVFTAPIPEGGDSSHADGDADRTHAEGTAVTIANHDADLCADLERASRELKARLVDDVGGGQAPRSTKQSRVTALAVGIAVPVCALGIYLLVGSPELLRPPPPHDTAQQFTPHEIEAMVERLAERLKTDSANVEGWMLLARSYAAFGRFQESADAYAT